MEKIISLILSLVMILSFTACGTKAEAGWKEQYDLGVKYVNEAKYEEAILAFTKALEIDPKQAPVYIALAEVYVRQENYTAAAETLDKAITEIGQTDELLTEKENLNDKQTSQNNNNIQGETPPQYYPIFSADEVPGVVRTEREDWNGYGIHGYNADGYELCKYWYNSDGILYVFDICTYDTNGNKIREDTYNIYGTIQSYKIWTYDANGNEIRLDDYRADGSLSYYITSTYDENGKLIRWDDYNADGSLKSYMIHTYNANGELIRQQSYNPDGTIME